MHLFSIPKNNMKKSLSFENGLIIFAVTIAAIFFVAAPLQSFFGLIGIALTELMFAVIVFAAIKVMRVPIREALPFNFPPVRAFFGGLMMYIGVYPITLVIIETTEYFFPTQVNTTVNSLVSVGSSLSPVASLIIMAIMPAICEELLHRGIILSCFKSLKKEWLIVLCCGLAFGIFHLDLYRFLPTGISGALMAYIAIKTGSMIIGMILHFFTNMISVYSIFLIAGSDLSSAAPIVYTPMILLTHWLIYSSIAILMISSGSKLLTGKKSKKTSIIVTISSFVLFAAGYICLLTMN